MKATLICFVFVLIASSLFAQPPDSLWSRLYGGTGQDECNAVKQTLDGGYVLAGRTDYSPTDIDAWMVKTNASGDLTWSRTSGGTGFEVAYGVVERSGGTGYAMAGQSTSFGGSTDFYLARISSSGAWQGHNHYGGSGGDDCESIEQTSDGGYILGGPTGSYGAGSLDYWLVKVDSAGNHTWDHTYGDTGYDECSVVLQTSDGGYALAGSSASFGDSLVNMWLVKTNSSGVYQWSRLFGLGDDAVEGCTSMQQTPDGGYILAGYTKPIGTLYWDFYLVKTDAQGIMQWSRQYGGSGDDLCWEVQRTTDGGYVLAGVTSSFGAGETDMWLLKVSSSGDSLWSRTFGGSNYDACLSFQQTTDGGFILGGTTTSFGAVGSDMWLVKTGPQLDVSMPRILLPLSYDLSAYPNPFNSTAMIRYDLPVSGPVEVMIFDLTGREVASLVRGIQDAGIHEVRFNGSALGSGFYLCRMEAGTFSATQKDVLLK